MAGRTLLIALPFVCGFVSVHVVARADVFELKRGGRVEGTLLERGDRNSYVVKSRAGAVIELSQYDVVKIIQQDAVVLEYQRRSRQASNTAEAHRELGAWCKAKGLTAQREHHLKRLLELEPDDEEARNALGYQRRGKRWMTREQIMQKRGMQLHTGRYRSQQEIALLERDRTRDEIESRWHGELKRLRSWLGHRRQDRVDEAHAAILAIDDPHAAPALVRWLDDETDEWTRRLLLDVLYPLDHPLAVTTLVRLSIYDEDPEFRLLCVDMLTRDDAVNKHGPPPLKPFVDALRSKDNEVVNQAAEALGVIANKETVSPLIEALVTEHKYIIKPGNGGQINANFTPTGGGGFSAGGNRPKIVRKPRQNLDVLRALGKITEGVDFGYDKQAWRRWYVNDQQYEFVSSRRDR